MRLWLQFVDDGQKSLASSAENAVPFPQGGVLCQQSAPPPQLRLVSQPVCFHRDAWLSQREVSQ